MEWSYSLPITYAKTLRNAIQSEDMETILKTLKICYKWILNRVDGYDEWEYENDIEEINFLLDSTLTEDDEEEIDYILDNFWNVCDGYRIWVKF